GVPPDPGGVVPPPRHLFLRLPGSEGEERLAILLPHRGVQRVPAIIEPVRFRCAVGVVRRGPRRARLLWGQFRPGRLRVGRRPREAPRHRVQAEDGEGEGGEDAPGGAGTPVHRSRLGAHGRGTCSSWMLMTRYTISSPSVSGAMVST